MSDESGPGKSPPATQKAERKAAAAAVDDSKTFHQTGFGRRRIRSIPSKVLGFIRVAGFPFVYLYHLMRGR